MPPSRASTGETSVRLSALQYVLFYDKALRYLTVTIRAPHSLPTEILWRILGLAGTWLLSSRDEFAHGCSDVCKAWHDAYSDDGVLASAVVNSDRDRKAKLNWAIKRHNAHVVRALLDAYDDAWVTSEQLTTAIIWGQPSIAELLLECDTRLVVWTNLCAWMLMCDAPMIQLILDRMPGEARDATKQTMLEHAIVGHKSVLARTLLGMDRPALADYNNSCGLALANDRDITRLLLSWPTHPARADAENSRALRCAAARGNHDMARLLLDWPDHPARADDDDSCALERAVETGDREMARLLLSWPTHPARADASLILMRAIQKGDCGMVRLLLGWPTHPARADGENSIVLSCAALEGRPNVMRLLLGWPEHAARADSVDGQRALIHAATRGDCITARILLNRRTHPAHADGNDNTALVNAAFHGHLKVARLLLGQRHHPARADTDYTLSNATRRGTTGLARLLLNWPHHPARADSHDGRRALVLAATNGHPKVVRLLMEHGARPEDDALSAAITAGHVDIVQLLLLKYTSDVTDHLMNTVRAGNLEVVSVLLESQAARHTRPDLGGMLNLAIDVGHVDIVRFLLLKYTDDVTDHLIKTVRTGNLDVVSLLLESLAARHTRPDLGGMLNLAIDAGHPDVARRLASSRDETSPPWRVATTAQLDQVLNIL